MPKDKKNNNKRSDTKPARKPQRSDGRKPKAPAVPTGMTLESNQSVVKR